MSPFLHGRPSVKRRIADRVFPRPRPFVTEAFQIRLHVERNKIVLCMVETIRSRTMMIRQYSKDSWTKITYGTAFSTTVTAMPLNGFM